MIFHFHSLSHFKTFKDFNNTLLTMIIPIYVECLSWLKPKPRLCAHLAARAAERDTLETEQNGDVFTYMLSKHKFGISYQFFFPNVLVDGLFP